MKNLIKKKKKTESLYLNFYQVFIVEVIEENFFQTQLDNKAREA